MFAAEGLMAGKGFVYVNHLQKSIDLTLLIALIEAN